MIQTDKQTEKHKGWDF